MKITSETKSKSIWTPKIFFPTRSYIIRVINDVIGPNSNSNLMVTNEWEICNQAPQQIGDLIVEFDGVKFKTYHVVNITSDPEKTLSLAKNYQDRVLKFAGINGEWDSENPPSIKGKCFYASLYGKKEVVRESQTPEQSANKQEGSVMKDPVTGDDVVTYRIQLDQIFGLFTGEVNNPF